MRSSAKSFFISIAFVLSSFTSAWASDTEVYTWRSENGNVVFSEKKPAEDVDYNVIKVGKPTIVDNHSITPTHSSQTININQSDIEKLASSYLAKKNKEALESNQDTTNFNVEIASPVNEGNIFTKEEKIAILTNPSISKSDKPTFIIDGSSVAASYEDGQWKINRPNPGKHTLKISGKTAKGQTIKSTNEVTFYIRNGWVQQSKNTGNYN